MQRLRFEGYFLLESNLKQHDFLRQQTPDLMYFAFATDKRYLQMQHNPFLKGQQEKDLSLPSPGTVRMSQLQCKCSFVFRWDGPIQMRVGGIFFSARKGDLS